MLERVNDQDTPPPTVARLSMLRRVKNREGVLVPAKGASPLPALERREPPMVEHPPGGPPSKPSVPRLPVVLGAGVLWIIFVLVLLCGVLVGPWMVDNFIRGRGTESSQSEAVETMMISSSTVARTSSAFINEGRGYAAPHFECNACSYIVALADPRLPRQSHIVDYGTQR